MLNVCVLLRKVETPLSLHVLSISGFFKIEFEEKRELEEENRIKCSVGLPFDICFHSFTGIL